MTYFFDQRQQEIQFQMQENAFMGMIQAHNQLDDLIAVMASLKATSLYRHISAHEQRLLQLARFKAFQLAITEAGDFSEVKIRDYLGDPPSTYPSRIRLDERGYIDLEENNLSEYEPDRADLRLDEPIGKQNKPPAYVEDRIAKLATLLRDKQKPEQFNSPNCLGYIHEADRIRFGFVFQGAGNFPPPRLLDMIASSSRPRPSLTTRLQIARAVATSIWYLHASNWLHKGLRSENIVFPFKPPAPPCLTGFDYTRPAKVTERPDNRYHDLYRHPLTQFEFPREGRDGFTKLYDIYSLGVVLYEIGMWKPVHVILGIDITAGIGLAEIEDTQKRLLSEECLMSLAADVGDVYMATVASCLSGDFGFDSFDGRNDQANYDARLQLEFGERVIRKLDSVVV
ncbi:hypothetical protein N0V82_000400 [Gnomoniopsis sp. IMI 355080]|nr:hypothetical protein N0V82_000400 [Gnomoniopsis sp. IMI 355080]